MGPVIPRVKICGITNSQDAHAAVCLGVQALGFVFSQSPRQLTPEQAREIIARLPPLVQTVGVFVDEKPALIKEIVEFCALDLVQFHGSEPPHVCSGFSPRVIKAFRMKDRSSLGELKLYLRTVRGYLLDAFVAGQRGGTGKTFDWQLAVEAKRLGVPIILSGGLNASNIRHAVSLVNPHGVDVSSGVEEKPGKKSPVLLTRLMKNLRGTDSESVPS